MLCVDRMANKHCCGTCLDYVISFQRHREREREMEVQACFQSLNVCFVTKCDCH